MVIMVVAQAVTSSAAQSAGVSRTWAQSAGAIPTGEAFDWQGDQPLRLPQVSATQGHVTSVGLVAMCLWLISPSTKQPPLGRTDMECPPGIAQRISIH